MKFERLKFHHSYGSVAQEDLSDILIQHGLAESSMPLFEALILRNTKILLRLSEGGVQRRDISIYPPTIKHMITTNYTYTGNYNARK